MPMALSAAAAAAAADVEWLARNTPVMPGAYT